MTVKIPEPVTLRPATPRRAAFHDLRVSQWVAWHAAIDNVILGGPVLSIDPEKGVARFECSDGRIAVIGRSDCNDDRLTILRDATAPPVTVRREDYDALVEASADVALSQRGLLWDAARDLITHADEGDTP